MTTDPTPLQERIARVMHADDVAAGRAADEFEAMSAESIAWYMSNAAAALPIIAGEVRAAKAEAWNECVRAAYTPEGRVTHGPNPYETGDQA